MFHPYFELSTETELYGKNEEKWIFSIAALWFDVS